ncbi:hypothetical protein, partial [Bradyrhizobium pachyrhizi]|uniref:hypothetical protein n=1 Tax=Bradyrhizobium pachyrhizi TaxID=280333 RepID=UPI001AEE6B49
MRDFFTTSPGDIVRTYLRESDVTHEPNRSTNCEVMQALPAEVDRVKVLDADPLGCLGIQDVLFVRKHRRNTV